MPPRRLICIAYQVPAAVMVLESWMKMAAEGEKLDMDERPSEAIDRHEVVTVMGDGGHSGKHGGAILPDTMRWLWRGYPGPTAK